MHQYIERSTGKILTEKLYADKIVNFIYASVRENSAFVFNALTNSISSALLGYLNYDSLLASRLTGNLAFLKMMGVNMSECLDPPQSLNTPRKIFERKIRYWDCRPMDDCSERIVSPADSKVLIGSLCETALFFIKEKFFSFEELLGAKKALWIDAFRSGDFAIFRLTPEKYHYNHMPVSGIVMDFYELNGSYHSCNPSAVINLVTPYSKNKRAVTIIDTDCEGGSYVGLVAMIEVAALMIGEIKQYYSEVAYDAPKEMKLGMFLKKGQPKSLFRPGSSTVVLLFQKDRVVFEADLIQNQHNILAKSRFSAGFGSKMVETDLNVRSSIATRKR
ncbi:MAG: phosphatidylserine decarboxylase [Dissulfuribacterales bacterium]